MNTLEINISIHHETNNKLQLASAHQFSNILKGTTGM